MEHSPKYIAGLAETKGEHVTRALRNVFDRICQLEKEKKEAKHEADLTQSRKNATTQSVREAQDIHAAAEARCHLLELQLHHIRTLIGKSLDGIIWDDIQTESKLISTPTDTYQSKLQIRKTVSKTSQHDNQHAKDNNILPGNANPKQIQQSVTSNNHNIERERGNISTENTFMIHSSEDFPESSLPHCHPSAPPMPNDIGITTLSLNVNASNNSEWPHNSLAGTQFTSPFLQPVEHTIPHTYSNFTANFASNKACDLSSDQSKQHTSFMSEIPSKEPICRSENVNNQTHISSDNTKNQYPSEYASCQSNHLVPMTRGFNCTIDNLEGKQYNRLTFNDIKQQSSGIPEILKGSSVSDQPLFAGTTDSISGHYTTGFTMVGHTTANHSAEYDISAMPAVASTFKKQLCDRPVQNMRSPNTHSYLIKGSSASQQELSPVASRIKNTSEEKEKSRTLHSGSELQTAEASSPVVAANFRSTVEEKSTASRPVLGISQPVSESTPKYSNISGGTLEEVPVSSKSIQDDGVPYVLQRDGVIYHTKNQIVRSYEHKWKLGTEDHPSAEPKISAESQNQQDILQTVPKLIEDGGSRLTPRNKIGSRSSPKSKIVPKMPAPFILGKSTGDSHSVPANIQNVRNILKNGGGKLRPSLNEYSGKTKQDKSAAPSDNNGTTVRYSSDLNSTRKDIKEIICQLEQEKSTILQDLYRCEKLVNGAAYPSLMESMVPELENLRQRLNEKALQINRLNMLLDMVCPSNHQQHRSQTATLCKNSPGHLFVTTEITTRPDNKSIAVQTTMTKATKTPQRTRNSEINSSRQMLHELRNIKQSLQESKQ